MRILLCTIAGFLLDLLLGDPEALSPVHPVVLMGKGIRALEKRLRRLLPPTEKRELTGGTILVCLMVTGTLLLSAGVLLLLRKLWWPLALVTEGIWCWQALAVRDLRTEVLRVWRTLTERTLPEARTAVSRIVGRDTERLDREGVIRAAVETCAESFSDGIAAPLFYMLLGGAPLALCYKAVSTMDSMLGYRNARYLYFGRAAAKLDDAANLLPSRLAALILIASAFLCGEDGENAMRIWRRDRRKHPSPNAGQCEAVAAGALGIQLGGGAFYFGTWHDKPFIGDALRPPAEEDIPAVCRMVYAGSVLCLLLLSALRLGGVLLTGG